MNDNDNDNDNDHAVVVERNDADGRYELQVDGRLAAFSTYRVEPGRIVVLHTETLRAYGGHGYGTQLVSALLDDVQARGERILPKCPFVLAYLEKHAGHEAIVDHE